MKQTMTIDFKLPTLNEVIALSKSHHMKYAKSKKQYTAAVALLAMAHLKPVTVYPIDIKFKYYCKNRRKDPDGIDSGARKVILDALYSAGIITGDGWREIRSLSAEFHIDKTNPRVEMVIDE